MHDPRALLDPKLDAVRRLGRRGFQLDLQRLQALVTSRNGLQRIVEDKRAESNRLAQEIPAAGKRGEDVTPLVTRARNLKHEIGQEEIGLRDVEEDLRGFLLDIPNIPADDCPDGDSEEFAVEVRTCGGQPAFDFTPQDHVAIGERLGIFDFKRATKLSGPRFAVLSGVGAQLERALTQFFLDLHTGRHGYTEYSVPAMVSRRTMTATGQLPKFEEDLFKTVVGDRELYLIPTAEVPLTNLYAGETIAVEDLPIAMTSATPCFRSEAGSYGRDTRGLIRLHQFAKVELVRICDPARSRDELETMLMHAETCLRELGLAYRVVALAAGDISFAAQFTYDVEVWLPGQQLYREISSCSDCATFQARRAGIRTRSKDGKRGFAATLNGSGLPIGRTLVAILEQYQEADGSVRIPDRLVPYLGFRAIAKDGQPAP